MGAGANFNGSVMVAAAVAARGIGRVHIKGYGACQSSSSQSEREAVAEKLRGIESSTGSVWDSFWVWVLVGMSTLFLIALMRLALGGALGGSGVAAFGTIALLTTGACEVWRRKRNSRIRMKWREEVQALSQQERKASMDAVDQLDWVWPKEAVPEALKVFVREL